ncbi:MAG: FecCD family ABC transporter permease [Coriobacteriia bacterium]
MPKTRRQLLPFGVVMAALVAAFAVALIAGVAWGAVSIAPAEVLHALARALRGQGGGLADSLVVQMRLPRVLIAAVVGASLAGAGVVYQALFRNPLADPYILGVSSGAGLGAMVALTVTAGATALRFGLVPAGAFLGALLTMLLVVRLALHHGRAEATSLLLAGVAVSYVLAAVTSFIMLRAREEMMALVYWMMGGLGSSSWEYAAMVAPMFALGALVPLLSTRELNLMLLGDERAGHLGLSVERFKLVMLGSASLMTAAAVAVAGSIGFVGLMTPHIMRYLVGSDHRRLLPASLLGGAIVLVLADLVARVILRPTEIPVGIVTAVLGGPFFVWLLVRGRSR